MFVFAEHTCAGVCSCVCEEADDPVGSSVASGRVLVFPLAGKPTSMIVTVTSRV